MLLSDKIATLSTCGAVHLALVSLPPFACHVNMTALQNRGRIVSVLPDVQVQLDNRAGQPAADADVRGGLE